MKKIALGLLAALCVGCNSFSLTEYTAEELVSHPASGFCALGFKRVSGYTAAISSSAERRAVRLANGQGGGGPIDGTNEQMVTHCVLGIKTASTYRLPDGRTLYLIVVESTVRGATYIFTWGNL